MAWFSHGFFRVEQLGDRATIADLRMGQEPNYTFTFAVAQQKPNPGWVESDYESGGSRGDIGEQLAWLWPRMLGADLPPPRERGPIEPLPDFHREPRARR